jgi:hypothetical protein
VRELKQFQALERAHARLQLEHDLLKKPSGSAPRESRPVRLHRHATRARLAVQRDAALQVLRGDARQLLRLAPTAAQCARRAGSVFPHGGHAALRGARRKVRQSPRSSRDGHRRVDREPAPHRPPHAGGGAPREGRARLSRQGRLAPVLRAASQSTADESRDGARSDLGRRHHVFSP